MGSTRHLFGQITDTPAFSQVLPGQPIVEIAGTHRVLVENHCGVKEYGHHQILIKVSYGCISVIGTQLELARMTKEQLVISGNIQCVQLLRKEQP